MKKQIKMKSSVVFQLFICVSLLIGFKSQAGQVSIESLAAQLANGAQAAVFSAEFDPPQKAHQEFIEELKQKYGVVILLVDPNQPFRLLSPVTTRLEMLNVLYSNDSQVVYVNTADLNYEGGRAASLAKLQNRMKSLGLKNQLKSFRLKDEELLNEQYLNARAQETALPANPSASLNPDVEGFVRANGLYLDLTSTKSLSRLIGLRLKLAQLVRKFVLTLFRYDMKQLVKMKRAPPPPDSPDRDFKVTKYLASGSANSAYIVQYQGEKALLKVSKGSPQNRDDIKQAVQIINWLAQYTDIPVPRIYEFEEKENWALIEFVPGKILSDLLKDRNLTPEEKLDLKKIHSTVLDIQRRTGMRIDMEADNVIFSQGLFYIIDPGPSPRSAPIEANFDRLLYSWGADKKSIQQGVPTSVSASLCRDAFN